jgi:hypothetical protein
MDDVSLSIDVSNPALDAAALLLTKASFDDDLVFFPNIRGIVSIDLCSTPLDSTAAMGRSCAFVLYCRLSPLLFRLVVLMTK